MVSPNHYFGRATSIRTRAHVAMAGLFGFQLDLSKLSDEEVKQATEMTSLAKRTRTLRAKGDLYRLGDPFVDDYAAWMVVAGDRREAIVTHVQSLAEAHQPPQRFKLVGLDPKLTYRSVEGPPGEWRGDFLMHVGLPIDVRADFQSTLYNLQVV